MDKGFIKLIVGSWRVASAAGDRQREPRSASEQVRSKGAQQEIKNYIQ